MTSTLTGGYLTIKTQAVKPLINPHTTALSRPVVGPALESLNWAQKTQWRINRQVLAVAEEARDIGIHIDCLPRAEDIPLPKRLPDHEWEALTKQAKAEYMRELEEIRGKNAHLAGLRAGAWRRLDVAKETAEFPALWFPHFLDFRGRLYPLAQDLHTQGDSLGKGLLEFARTSPLGANGQWWLYVAFANAMGNDKIALQARADWTDNLLTTILAAARDPMAYLDFWAGKDADSPWEALALCFEIARLCDWVAGGKPASAFESQAPLRLDATCSGIQHLSAMMKDELSARCVNVSPTGKREDIYGDVAAVVRNQVALDAANGKTVALAWLGKVERKTVKRAVMTTPYGVTPRGIVEQLVADGFCNFIKDRKERWVAAEYMRDAIVNGLDASIGAPRAAMAYFQDVARHLAEQNVPLQWTTPAGVTVRQGYFETQDQRIETLAGKISMRVEKAGAPLDLRKQTAAAAPNVVHSYDAAHLCLTVAALKQEGIRDLALVHDSFGTHAGHADTLARVTREQFVSMYDRPALEEWRQSVITHSGRDDIPAIPATGSLDVSRVLESEFFFS